MSITEKDLKSPDMFTPQNWAARNGFAHWAIAMLWLVAALILFQVVASVFLLGMLILSGDLADMQDIGNLLAERIDLLFIGNSFGQILFIGLATFAVVKLHTVHRETRSFLRLKWHGDTVTYIILGGLLMLAVQPLVIYLGYLNSLLPMPDFFADMQFSQKEMIENFLTSEGVLLFGLFHIAVVPAICEEVLFRGYVMRAFEKSWGIITAIIVSGIIFGMFHLQLGNLLPLATLGMILAIMTWLSGSIWPAVVAHFLNNGSAVVVGINYPELAFADISAEALPPIWLLLLSIAATSGIIYMMFTQTQQNETPHAERI